MIWAHYYQGRNLVGYVPVYTEEERDEMATKKQKEEFARRSAAAKKAAATRARNKAAAAEVKQEQEATDTGFGDGVTTLDLTGPTVLGTNDNVFYVVLERGIMSAKARSLHATRSNAENTASALEQASMAPYNKFTVARVELAE